MIAVSIHWSCAVHSKQLPQENHQICSHFLVPVANAEAIRQGDVLIRETCFFDSINGYGFDQEGILLQETTYYRVVFDFDQEYFACYKHEKKEVSSLSLEKKIKFFESVAQGDGKFVSVIMSGFCFDGKNSILFREFPGGIQKRNRNSYSEEQALFLNAVGFRDYRFPLNNFEGSSRAIYTGSETFRRHATGDSLESYELLPDNILEIQLKAPPINIQLPEGLQIKKLTTVFRFSLVDSSVVFLDSSRIEFIDEKGTKPVSQLPTSYSWTLKNNVQVVKSVLQKRYEEFTTYGGDVYKAPADRRLALHWFSVNEPVKAEFFDGSVLKSRESFLAVVDPEANDASELIIPEIKIKADSK
jgi:hypothetical protein